MVTHAATGPAARLGDTDGRGSAAAAYAYVKYGLRAWPVAALARTYPSRERPSRVDAAGAALKWSRVNAEIDHIAYSTR